ncbi:glutaredoxin [Globomyces pollinis-pini]|nr:glutaredoxin [Globomyces pollinis-pini]
MGNQNSKVSGNTEQLVQDIIRNNPVVLFSKTNCPYCRDAKYLLKQQNIDFKSYDLNIRQDGKLIQDYLYTVTGIRTVPNIFINGINIGGCNNLITAHTNGKLKLLLEN